MPLEVATRAKGISTKVVTTLTKLLGFGIIFQAMNMVLKDLVVRLLRTRPQMSWDSTICLVTWVSGAKIGLATKAVKHRQILPVPPMVNMIIFHMCVEVVTGDALKVDVEFGTDIVFTHLKVLIMRRGYVSLFSI